MPQKILACAGAATGVPLYTDARHYAAAGIPTVLYGAGPRSILEANAHGADEHLQLSDLRAATEVVALDARGIASDHLTVKVVGVGAVYLDRDDVADADRQAARQMDCAVDLRRVRR